MKYIYSLIVIFSIFLFAACEKDETYPSLPNRVYVGAKASAGSTTFTGSTSAKKNIANGIFRVFVNHLSDKDVSVTYTLSGTAVAGQDYNPPALLTVTVPAGSYFVEVQFTVLNNPAQTSNKTIIVTLTGATEGFELGLGQVQSFKTFTYTITP